MIYSLPQRPPPCTRLCRRDTAGNTIHEDLGPATTALFAGSGFTDVVLKKDLQGKDRMVRAVKSA
ncbi:hypothetical protein HB364_10635 [Pseudoflavitalea sp. X16]|nr:hypothetical protein [Paraflavitalea devenefica]